MELRQTTIDGKLVEILDEKDYSSKYQMYADNPSMYQSSAMEIDGYVLPFRGKTDDRPGIYPDGSIYFVKTPTIENADEYRTENLNIVDFSDVSNIMDFLNKNSQIRDMETTVLTDIDSVFSPIVSPNDSPEMKAFKEAIIAKHIDINRYASRFGDNFLNDKRILKTNSITMNKLVSMCRKLDIEAELILRDTNSNVANPMSKEIRVILTGDGGEEQ